jgi:hypothetical protein
MINWIECGRKRSWSNLRNYPRTCMETMKKTTKNLNQNSRSADRDLKPESAKYEAGVLVMKFGISLYCD